MELMVENKGSRSPPPLRLWGLCRGSRSCTTGAATRTVREGERKGGGAWGNGVRREWERRGSCACFGKSEKIVK